MHTVVAVSPHPDDELLGAGATLMALRDAGWRVVNFACSLGRPADQERRRRELVEACDRARFELVIADPPAAIGAGDDPARAQRTICEGVSELITQTEAELLVGPSPHDGHHGHEPAGRAICDAVEARGQSRGVLFWGLWSGLAIPNVFVAFDGARMADLQRALAAHAGELARNRFDRLLTGRAQANAVLGAERVFGFGAAGQSHDYAELLTAVGWSAADGWRLATPGQLDPERPVDNPGGAPIGWWLRSPSAAASLRSHRG